MSIEMFIVLLFAINLAKALIVKLCSHRLDHQMMPIIYACYLLVGLILSFPAFQSLAMDGITALLNHPIALAACLAKGVVFWFVTVDSQKLTKESLSSSRYSLPPALALAACANAFLGEALNMKEWISVVGLALLGLGFFLKGHLQDLSKESKIIFIKVVLMMMVMIVIDHYVIVHSNWYVLLFLSNVVIVGVSFLKRSPKRIWKEAFTNKLAMVAGVAFCAYEMIKFPAMVTILPVSVVVTVQVATIPVIMVLTSVIWKERTVKEQLLWGVLSMIFMMMLLL